MKWLERIANISVIVTALVFIFVASLEFFPSKFQLPSQNSLASERLVGKPIKIPGLELPRERMSLILFLSTSCPYCKESLPFYQQLSRKLQGKVDLIAVFPQPQEQLQAWLEVANVPVSQIISAKLYTLGIPATPSLLLLDKTGKVKKIWVGRLDEQRQADLLSCALR
jgi:thiol-disulfide isomerase/thioredoxin